MLKDILITKACINDIDEIMKLKEDVWNKIENKDWYFIDGTTNIFLNKIIKNDGLILKATIDNKIIGFLVVENNKKKDSEIIKKSNLEREVESCIEMSSVAVNYKYRGNHLFTEMLNKAEKYMLDKYNIKYILATVHPDNLASKNTLLNSGYNIYCRTKMYGGKDRCILLKKVK